MRVALVNTNRSRPPVAPIGLEYVAAAVHAAGHDVAVLDLCWATEWEPALRRFLEGTPFELVGLTLRNTDDCMMSGGRCFLPEFAAMARVARSATEALLVVGGVGFSVMPRAVMQVAGAACGIWGDGEFALTELLRRLHSGERWDDVPRLVRPAGDAWQANPAVATDLALLPPMARDWFDNRRYFREGGQGGFESHRGCPGRCTYCADPVAKGHRSRCRPPVAVGAEVAALLAQGIDHLHTCDPEFNIPLDHALSVCVELGRRGLGSRLRWYAYCAPEPFPAALARAMRAAGCAGINFGTDSADPQLLRRLGRGYRPAAIAAAVRTCRSHGMAAMVDLLLGVPGETPASLRRTIEYVRQADPDCVGVSLGVRLYPGTPLADLAATGALDAGLVGGAAPTEPLYYLEPDVAADADRLLQDMIGDDRRFFYAPAGPERDYNYAGNTALTQAIAAGERGAYWDILRRLRP